MQRKDLAKVESTMYCAVNESKGTDVSAIRFLPSQLKYKQI